MRLFKNRCPQCRGIAHTVHELEPRSRGITSMRMQNRTAICHPCHDAFHRLGASNSNILRWKEIIKDYLTSIGAYEEYINWGVELD